MWAQSQAFNCYVGIEEEKETEARVLNFRNPAEGGKACSVGSFQSKNLHHFNSQHRPYGPGSPGGYREETAHRQSEPVCLGTPQSKMLAWVEGSVVQASFTGNGPTFEE